MAAPSNNRVLMASDVLYFITFAAGMAAFWISGHASQLLPAFKSHSLAVMMSLVVTGGVYGLGMVLLGLLVTRHLGKTTVIATIISVILGLGAAQIIVRLAANHIHTNTGVGLLTFALYLAYGVIYVVSLATARRFAK